MIKKQNKLKEFIKKHFEKERRICPHCGKDIDAYVKHCPHCYERAGESILPRRFQNMVFLTDYKLLLFFLIGTVGLFLFNLMITAGLESFYKASELSKALEGLISTILVLSVFACILSYDFKEITASFKKSLYHIRPILASIIGLAIIVIFSYSYQGIFLLCGRKIADSANQNNLIEMIRSQPTLCFFYVVLLGPLLEEITYRVGLFTLFRKRNRYLAYIITILVFALGHFNLVPNDSTQLINEFINLPLYLFPAFILTLLYEYEGLSTSTYTHVLNNLISFIIILAVR